MLDVDALSTMIADIVSEEVGKAVAPLHAKIGELEAKPAGVLMDEVKAVAEIMISDAIVHRSTHNGVDGKDGRDGVDGKDGRGVKELLIDRGGDLIATMDDGQTKNLGPVIGKDGAPGKDGRDGLGWEDFDVEVVDERTFALKFQRDERVQKYEITIPAMIDAGVYKEGTNYVRGDAVTWGGSLWVAQRDTSTKPDTQDSGWRLAVKRGRDGKDAKNG